MKLQDKQIGTYRLLSLIGKGQTSEVWRATHTLLNREVAVKFVADPDGMITERFGKEADRLGQLEQLNILPVIDYGAAQDYLYIVTPFVPGTNLQDQMQATPLERPRAFEVFKQLLNGLAFAHAQGVVHGNLKPANILLYPDGRAVITDFGLVTATGLNENISLTLTGNLSGSPEYMAPEQFLGQTSLNSDLYSAALILYRMLTGQEPYRGGSAWEIGMRHLNDPLPLPHPLIPASFESFFARALHKRPTARFASADQMREAFRHATQRLSAAELAVYPALEMAQTWQPPRTNSQPSRPPVVQPPAVATPAKPTGAARYWPIELPGTQPPTSSVEMTRPSPSTYQPSQMGDRPLHTASEPLAGIKMPLATAKPKAAKSPARRSVGRLKRWLLIAAIVSGWLLTLLLATILIFVLMQTGGLR